MLPMRTTTEAVSQKQRIKFDTNLNISLKPFSHP